MYNMSMLRHRFSNEWWGGGGGGGALNHLPLLFCKSVNLDEEESGQVWRCSPNLTIMADCQLIETRRKGL